jgi:ribosomal protein S18 acetylase RimI-like enzyme
MIRLRKFERFVSKGKTDEAIEFINDVRSNYTFSHRTYAESDTANIYLIIWQGKVAGFCEVEIQNTCLEVPWKTQLYLHELHVTKKAQRKGIGRDTIYHILELGLPIKLVVANDNAPMVRLVKNFGADILYEPKNIKTYIINPDREKQVGTHA